MINISGLAIGMACTILILLWVQDELSYDRFHKNIDDLYRIVNCEKYSSGEDIYFTQCSPALAPFLKDNYPEIVNAVRYRGLRSSAVKYGDKKFNEEDIVFVDSHFFTMFSYSFLQGDPETALSEPNNIIITQEMARKYFGKENPIGKVLRIDNRIDFSVTGVLKDIPSNSHQQFDFLLPFKVAKEFGFHVEGWKGYAHTVYVKLDNHIDYQSVSDKITNVVLEKRVGENITLSLQPVKNIHLRSGRMWGIGGTGDIKYVYIFSIIAMFILLLACINFMNLSTARSGNRSKEVGLRKVVGARRNEIIFQFFSESILFALISLIISIVLVQLVMPAFNFISGKELDFNLLSNSTLIFLLLGIALFTGFISGSYPALFLSSFAPVKVLKGSLQTGAKNTKFRKVLVSAQFVLTIFLIISTIVINRQLHFLKNQKLGYNKDKVVCVNLQGQLNRRLDLITSEFKKNKDVMNISAVSNVPSRITMSAAVDEWDGHKDGEQYLAHLLSADYEFLNTLELDMVDGRYFSRDIITDTADGLVVNESALQAMNMDNPIGKKTAFGTIIGVVKNFNFQSLHIKVSPLVIFYGPQDVRYLIVKIKGNDNTDYIESLKSSWQKVAADYPFEYSFLDERLDQLYRAEQRIEDVMNAFTFLAILIACLGLFGLASFTAEQRTKEVGIRKVLGASVPGIVLLLSKEFTKYVQLANIIAWPIAWFALNKYLQYYAYRINIDWWIFVCAGLLTFLIALLTVSYQAFRAAITNPVKALKYE